MYPYKHVVVSLLAILLVAADDRKNNSSPEPLPAGAVLRIGRPTFSILGNVKSIAFSPDGTSLAAESETNLTNSRTRIWSAADGQVEHSFDDDDRRRRFFCRFSRDGSVLYGSSKSWKLDTKESMPWPFKEKLLAISPDDRFVVLAFVNQIKICDRTSGKPHCAIDVPAREPVIAISPDSDQLVVGANDGRLQIRQCPDGKLLREIELPLKRDAICVAFSPDGKRVAASVGTGEVAIYDVKSGAVTIRFSVAEARHAANKMVFSPDGKLLATAGFWSSVVNVWDAASGELRQRISGKVYDVQCLAFSPDSRLLAVGGDGARVRNLRIWNMKTGAEYLPPDGATAVISKLRYSPDGRYLAFATQAGAIHLWDAHSRYISNMAGIDKDWRAHQVAELEFSADGWVLAAVTDAAEYRLWETASRMPLLTQIDRPGRTPDCAAISPSFRHLAESDYEGNIRIRNFNTGAIVREFKVMERLRSEGLAYSPDGNRLAIAFDYGTPRGKDDVIHLWNLKRNEFERTFKFASEDRRPARASDLTFSPDGSRLAARIERETLVFDVASGQVEFRLPRSFGAFCFSHDSRYFAAADGPRFKVIELATGEFILERGLAAESGDDRFRRRPQQVLTALEFGPYGRRLATGVSGDHTILVWTLRPEWDRPNPQPKEDEIEKLWLGLANRNVAVANRAVWRLIKARERAADFILKHISPAAPAAKDETATFRAIETRHNAESLRRIRATEVLEQITSQQAIQALQKIGSGHPTARETVLANAALRRLKSQGLQQSDERQ